METLTKADLEDYFRTGESIREISKQVSALRKKQKEYERAFIGIMCEKKIRAIKVNDTHYLTLSVRTTRRKIKGERRKEAVLNLYDELRNTDESDIDFDEIEEKLEKVAKGDEFKVARVKLVRLSEIGDKDFDEIVSQLNDDDTSMRSERSRVRGSIERKYLVGDDE